MATGTLSEQPSIAVVIPSIPPRQDYLLRAMRSVMRQTLKPAAISIAIDHHKLGAGPTRTKALRAAHEAEWVAFLDDDDEFLPQHLDLLWAEAQRTGADVVWPWFLVSGGRDPIPGNRGRQWDSSDPHTFPMPALVRNELAQRCDFPEPIPNAACSGEDWAFWIQMDKLGAKFHHVDEITWIWHHDSHNTSGRPDRW